jgi:hypothetical protein
MAALRPRTASVPRSGPFFRAGNFCYRDSAGEPLKAPGRRRHDRGFRPALYRARCLRRRRCSVVVPSCCRAAAARPHRDSCCKGTTGLEWATGAKLLSTRQVAAFSPAFSFQLPACSLQLPSLQPTFPRLRHVIPSTLIRWPASSLAQLALSWRSHAPSRCRRLTLHAVCVLSCLQRGRLVVLVDPLRTDHRVVNASRRAKIPVDLRAATASACTLPSTPSSRLSRPLPISRLARHVRSHPSPRQST